MSCEDDGRSLFAIPDFWQSSDRLEQSLLDINRGGDPIFSLHVSESQHSLLAGDGGGEPKLLEAARADLANAGFFKLPPFLRELAFQQVSEENKPAPRSELEPPEPESSPVSEDDIWLYGNEDIPKPPEYKTWDRFNQDSQEQISPVFITEAGPAAFDVLLALDRASLDTGSDVIDDASYCACLLSLALGRSSVLFSWDAAKHSFFKTKAHLRTSGLSLESIQGIDNLCLDCANAIRNLQSFVETTYSTSSAPTSVALAGVVGRLVLAIQSELGARSGGVRSILQLQSLVRPAESVLSYFQGLVDKLARQRSEEGMLSCLFQEVQSAEYRDGLVREATCEVLRQVSRPWTDFVEEWVGLRAEMGAVITKQGPGKSFVTVTDSIWLDDQGFELEEADYFLDEDKMPSFVPADIAQEIFETGRNLRFLKDHHPEHALSRQNAVTLSKPPKLEWQFDWDAITQLEARVQEYQDAVSLAVQSTTLEKEQENRRLAGSWDSSGYELNFFGKSEDQIAANVLASIGQFDEPLDAREDPDKLTMLLRTRLYPGEDIPVNYESFSPHWSLVPLLSFGPVIGVQSRLVNYECMKLLFSAHDIRIHIDLLKQCYLLGNGLLCSRLSHALFDPDLETAERKAGVALLGGVMGLRLGSRENWPPASSELRLALMGVLSDSYQPPPSQAGGGGDGGGGGSHQAKPIPASRTLISDLPGDLSFAVRDLSPEEIDRCMDPDAVEALDFLQLSYKPPSTLRSVMTPLILSKYDRIFRHLLRIQRMLYVVNQLFRDIPLANRRSGQQQSSNASARFCVEARQFVSQIAAYFFATGVTAPWRRFEAWLHMLETELLGDTAGDGSKNNNPHRVAAREDDCSPATLRDRQEQVLDDIMSALLLRKRQAPVLKLLEEIFTVVLRFARQVRVRAPGGVEARGHQKEADTPERLYAVFRKRVEVFVTVCKGLGEKTTAAASGGSKRGLCVDENYIDDEGGGGGVRGRGKGQAAVESPIETLVLMLDMSGFYSKKPVVG
ncbi:Spc98 family-domain-containing protein [Bombardia bombarda]|uniref:Spindle pole body component n=1 Tax=Bombardia bombarda TaxID=252184 RepID=A0AA40C968_9PEZI|nr:Spc98 family-domain-containing protein [Bombardia bombarda]